MTYPNPRLLRDPVPAESTPVRHFCCAAGARAFPDPCPWAARHRESAVRGTHAVAVALLHASALVPQQRSTTNPQETPQRPLTPREREIVGGWAAGLRSHEIAHSLGLSSDSVYKTGQMARLSLGARTQSHAVALALLSGQIQHAAAPVRD